MSPKSRPVESDIDPGSNVRPAARARSLGKLRTIPETAEIRRRSGPSSASSHPANFGLIASAGWCASPTPTSRRCSTRPG